MGIRPNRYNSDKQRLGKSGVIAEELGFEGCNNSGYYA
jgi:hypothetical protein